MGTWTLTGTKTATASAGIATFAGLGATNAAQVNNAQLGFTSGVLVKVTSATVTLPAPAGAYTATAAANTLAPAVGIDNAIILTVKNSLGAVDTNFNGAKNVTITGVIAAPNGSYGSFNGTVLNAGSAGAGQVISVTFAAGVASVNVNLKLNKAAEQTIGFSIATVTTPAANALTITPSNGAAASMAVTQDITAPGVNGGNFAQQPKVTLKDAYGNPCSSDNATVITVAQEDMGTWTLTGTKTATASAGIATFAGLGATNAAQVNNAQLGFTSGVLVKVTSATVTLPAPAGAYTATAAANTLAPAVGIDNAIILTVKNSLGAVDTNFNGAKNVTITGVIAAPNGSYGSFNGTVLNAGSAGAGQVISVTFAAGVANVNVNLKLSKAAEQTIGFSIATVTTPAANALTITPGSGAAASMAVTQDITAPGVNGGNFAQQPQVTLKDGYGNICINDNTTQITVSKKDSGTWTLTGTPTATASSGVVTFGGLGASNSVALTDAQLAFDATGLTQVTSGTVTLPAPVSDESSNNPAPNPAPTPTEVIVNGQIQDAGTTSTTTVGNQTVTTVTIDDKKIGEKLDTEGNNATVVIPVSGSSDVMVGVLNGQTIKNMETKEAVLEIRTESVTYTLPAIEINIDNVSAQIGEQVELKDIQVSVSIAAPPQDTVKIIQDTANKNNYQVVVQPIDFEITCTSGGKTVDVSKFNGYVERTVAIPAGIDPSKITTGVVLNKDGTFSHVPTTIIIIDGKYYAKITSLTNSTYSVIYNPKTFKDVENHWAKEAVDDMGSRLVISGVGNDLFEPDRDITRAEFAAIVVKGLGIKPGNGINSFNDVNDSEWYSDFIKTAYEYNIISGFGDGKFGPMDKITREQAMTMIARAMVVTGLKVEYKAGEEEELLAEFADANESAAWAKHSLADCVKAGIITGKNGKMLAPKDDITRAEVAVIVKKLLQKSALI